jgi:Mg2+ and Co2+ transporter CorA
MKTIAIMTMVFLPPTFIAIFFTMPLLKWDGPKFKQSNFALYWAFLLPTRH